MATQQNANFSSLQLPSRNTENFLQSSFFTASVQPRELPAPARVRARDASRPISEVGTRRRNTVQFSAMNLMVKFGAATSIAEGQCLWLLRTCLGPVTPVPEVYGWCKDGGQVFVYMELVRGSTLEQRWDELSRAERFSICDQLRPMITALQTLKQDPSDCFIGNVGGGPLQDIFFEGRTIPSPFKDSPTFHNWFSWPLDLARPDPPDDVHPMRKGLPDDPICFTHGDLHPSNILVTSKGPPRVMAIIDWHQSGWYPAYWEYCKTRWTAEIGSEWVNTYIPRIMEPRPKAYHHWDYFVLCLGM